VPNKPVKIACQWSGIMAFGKDKLPVVKLIEPNIAVGARLNGMGIALGSKIAKDLAGLLI
jgi:glycine/D-amino acid oxidase-like deaminating enzyme